MAKRRKNGKKPPLCGDRLVDLLFKMMLDAIYYRISSIKKKKVLTDPDEKDPKKRRKTLYGLYDPDTKEVFLSASKCKHPTNMSMIPALVHETFHEIMPDVFHHRIHQLERVLKIRLTDEQKRYLRKFIPKHEVKIGPRASK